MIRVLSTFLLAAWCAASTAGAQTEKMPTAEKQAEENRSAFAVEQRARETPIRFERDCPPPEMVDVIQSSAWNTVEIGVSLPLGESAGEARLYTRYTCPAPWSTR